MALKRKGLDIEEKRLEQLKADLHAVRKLKGGVENPDMKLFKLLSEKERKLLEERDQQIKKLLRMHSDQCSRTSVFRFLERVIELPKLILHGSSRKKPPTPS